MNQIISKYICISLLLSQFFGTQSFAMWGSNTDVEAAIAAANKSSIQVVEQYFKEKNRTQENDIIPVSILKYAFTPSMYLGFKLPEKIKVSGNDVQQMSFGFLIGAVGFCAGLPLAVPGAILGAVVGVGEVAHERLEKLWNPSAEEVCRFHQGDFKNVTPEDLGKFNTLLKTHLKAEVERFQAAASGRTNLISAPERPLDLSVLGISDGVMEGNNDVIQSVLESPFLSFLTPELFESYCDHFKLSRNDSLERVHLLGNLYYLSKNHDWYALNKNLNQSTASSKKEMFNYLFSL